MINFGGAWKTLTEWLELSAFLDGLSGGTPGGDNTQVQFNDGGAFGGDADFTWISGGIPSLLVGDPSLVQHSALVEIAANIAQLDNGVALEVLANSTADFETVTLFAMQVIKNSGDTAGNMTAGQFHAKVDGLEHVVSDTSLIHASSGGSLGVGGEITNFYGLMVDDLIFGVNNWAIKTGLGLVEFGDKINAANLPSGTSEPGGLSVGDLWVDTTAGLNIVKVKL